jgi:hypothetical protein
MTKIKKAGIIYTAKCIITGEFYVGATTDSIKQRQLDHIKRAQRGEVSKFHEAISTHGPDAFEWNQTDSANSVDELAQKEKEYIVKFNAKEQGYNSDAGGGFKKSIYQYDLRDGSLINRFDCLESASNEINAIKQQLSRACLSVNQMFNGYYWSYKYIVPFKPNLDNRKRSIVQSDDKGNEIAIFNSIAEASKLTGFNKSSIAKVCRGERNHAGGYKWSYK